MGGEWIEGSAVVPSGLPLETGLLLEDAVARDL